MNRLQEQNIGNKMVQAYGFFNGTVELAEGEVVQIGNMRR